MTQHYQIGIDEILDLIPHRYPLLLVDRVIKCVNGSSITGIKNVTFNEPQFNGHFPNNPVMPGVLIIESLAQIAAILVAKTIDAKSNEKSIYFMSIDNAKFRQIVKPGDVMYLYAEIVQHRSDVWKFIARAEVHGEIVAVTMFTAMVRDQYMRVYVDVYSS